MPWHLSVPLETRQDACLCDMMWWLLQKWSPLARKRKATKQTSLESFLRKRKRARRSRRKRKRRLLPRKRKLQSEDNISRSASSRNVLFVMLQMGLIHYWCITKKLVTTQPGVGSILWNCLINRDLECFLEITVQVSPDERWKTNIEKDYLGAFKKEYNVFLIRCVSSNNLSTFLKFILRFSNNSFGVKAQTRFLPQGLTYPQWPPTAACGIQ